MTKCTAATLGFHIPDSDSYKPVPVTLVEIREDPGTAISKDIEALSYDGGPLKFEDEWDEEDWKRRAQISDKIDKNEIKVKTVQLFAKQKP